VHGYRVLYRTSAQLLSDLTASLARQNVPVRVRRYASPDLLLSMSSGVPTASHASSARKPRHLLYKIIAASGLSGCLSQPGRGRILPR